MHHTGRSSASVLALAVVLLGGCAGNGEGLDQSGRPLAPGGGLNGPLTADFASIQFHILTPICTACHAGGAAPRGLRLDSINSYSLLVGIPSTEVPSVLRVKPGDPNNSYIIQKLEGHAAVGARMPFGGPYLEQGTIDIVRQWIIDGALPTASATGVGFAVTSINPATHVVLRDARAPLVVGFNEELDQTRLDGGSVRLEEIDRATGATIREMPVRLSVPAGNPKALMVVPVAPFGDGLYRLTALTPPATGLSGISGSRLGGSSAVSGPVLLAEFEFETQP